MKPQDILIDIEKAIISRWGSKENCESLPQIKDLHEQIKVQKKLLKKLRAKKKELSRQFSTTHFTATEQQTLKSQVAAASSQLKLAEKQLKHDQKCLIGLFAKHDKVPEFAERFSYVTSEKTSPSEFEIVQIEHSAAKQWDSYAENHPASAHAHNYKWRDIFEKIFNCTSKFYAAKTNTNQFIGILPVYFLKSRLFGHFAVTVPYLNYGGPLADNRAVEEALLNTSAKDCEHAEVEYLEVRATRNLNDWPSKNEKLSMVLALPESEQCFDQNIGAKIRAQINRSRRFGFEKKIGKSELVEDFYAVFSKNMRDLGTPVYSKRFFTEMAATFKKSSHIVVLYLKNKPVSAAFLLGHKDVLEIPWASTRKNYNSMDANMLLYREVLGFAISNDYKYFDFGRSSKDSSTYKFKKQWGAQPVKHHWHYWLAKNSALPELSPNNPKYKILIKIWKILPVFLTKIIGPPIVSRIP